jgi:hypothetical protein
MKKSQFRIIVIPKDEWWAACQRWAEFMRKMDANQRKFYHGK